MSPRDALTRLLNNRDFCSGSVLGRTLGISRAAIHQHIRALRESGLPIDSVRGRGYRLGPGIVLLDAEGIRQRLSEPARCGLRRIHVVPNTSSTNTCLRRLAEDADIHAVVCLAEAQSAGRGRRGNQWIATPYRNLMLSMGWRFAGWPADITALGVAVAMTLLDVFSRLGIPDIRMKWPNDLMRAGCKLGGVLIDVDGESTGPCRVIVGVGINVHIAGDDGERIDQPWVDLERICGAGVDRNALAAAVIDGLMRTLTAYPDTGFDVYRERWAERDVVAGRWVDVRTHDRPGVLHGRVTGITGAGALRVRDAAGVETTCYQGDVSVRPR